MQGFGHVRDEKLRRLLAYWFRLRGDRTMPARKDLDPVDLYFALPQLWLYDYAPPDDFRCRLLGEDIIELFGRNPKGLLVKEIFPGDSARNTTDRLMTVVTSRSVMHSFSDVTTTDHASLRGERLALPLSADGVNVDAILGATVYDRSAQAKIAGTFATERMQLTYTTVA